MHFIVNKFLLTLSFGALDAALHVDMIQQRGTTFILFFFIAFLKNRITGINPTNNSILYINYKLLNLKDLH